MMNELMIDISVDEDSLPSAGTNEEFSTSRNLCRARPYYPTTTTIVPI